MILYFRKEYMMTFLLLFTEASMGTFYSIINGKQEPFYNDAEEEHEEKLRLEADLNEVVIGHWKSHDDQEEYYSKV